MGFLYFIENRAMFAEIENEELRKLTGALLVSVSLASATVVLFVTWFIGKFMKTTAVVGAPGTEREIIARQQHTISQLESRLNDMEHTVRELKLRVGDPPVPMSFQ